MGAAGAGVMSKCWVCNLGRIDYETAAGLQCRLLELRCHDRIDDIVLLLEHPPTITLGKFAKRDNILVSPAELERRGIALCPSDRGGDATVHCPGQLVVYPIMSLRNRGGRLRDFIKDLEEVVIRTLLGYGIPAERWSEHPGIWVEGQQIAAIGLRISRSVSMHGLSLNVNPDSAIFNVINLCGLPGKKATSISQLLGKSVALRDVMDSAMRNFAAVFNVDLEQISRLQVLEDTRGA